MILALVRGHVRLMAEKFKTNIALMVTCSCVSYKMTFDVACSAEHLVAAVDQAAIFTISAVGDCVLDINNSVPLRWDPM